MTPSFIALICIVVILLLLNIYVSHQLLNGSWESTDEFTERSATKIFINIKGGIMRDCRVVMINATGENVVLDGTMTFINYNPLLLFQAPTTGHVLVRGFEAQGTVSPFPKKMKFHFNPLRGHLKLYGKVCYAELAKVC